jgi:hypothetical protein
MPKYDPLRDYLAARGHLPEVRLTLAEVGTILGSPLPNSAFDYREWWANQSDTTNRPQAAAWLDAGFVVGEVHQDRATGWVVSTAARRRPSPAGERPLLGRTTVTRSVSSSRTWARSQPTPLPRFWTT